MVVVVWACDLGISCEKFQLYNMKTGSMSSRSGSFFDPFCAENLHKRDVEKLKLLF